MIKCRDCKVFSQQSEEGGICAFCNCGFVSNEDGCSKADVIEDVYELGYNTAIDDMKQFLYAHKHIDYTSMLLFLDNLEQLKAGEKNEAD